MSVRLFLSELKRREVYRVVIVYATVAWVLLEGADIVFPRLGFQDESVTLVLILVTIGFPIAIYLAWVYDITPDGIIRTPPLSPGTKHHFSWARITEFVVIAALVALIGHLYLDRLTLQERLAQYETGDSEPGSPAQTPHLDPEKYRAVAVLPFHDMSQDQDQAWFAEGISEELLHALASVPGLKVTARTSSFAFKNTEKTIAEIAEILGVQAVLEGSVRRSGERIRITAQLIDASSGYHIWSESYERELTDIFLVQDELAQSIVKTLRLELGGHGTDRLIAEKTDKPEAYHAFIRGRALMDWSSPMVLNESVEYFERAVTADPHYAEAWGFLALSRAFTALWHSTAVASEPATAAAEKALALNPNQSEALAAKAWMTQLLEWDWETAGSLYQRSLSFGRKPPAMFTYGAFYLVSIDAIPRALEILAGAEELDPLHAGYKGILAHAHVWAGDPQAAIEKAQEALEINPQHVFALMALIEAYMMMGDCSTALALVENMPEFLRKEPRINGRAGVCHAALGETEIARAIYDSIIENTPSHYPNMQAAVLALSLGEVEDALDVMEAEVESHSWPIQFIRVYFRHDERMNSNPRFQALLERMGLDDESVEEIRRNLDAIPSFDSVKYLGGDSL